MVNEDPAPPAVPQPAPPEVVGGSGPTTPGRFVTRAALVEDLRTVGLRTGDVVMVHAAVSRVGRLLNGPDAVIGALLDAVGPTGTVVAYTDWDASYVELLDEEGRVPEWWRPHVAPYEPSTSRAARDYGVLPEFLRTTPGSHRSGNPGASVAALGARAEWLTDDHPLDYGYGPGSPLARLCEIGARILMLGAPPDTMTILHHAEHLADLPDKRIVRTETPFRHRDGTRWRTVEEFDTSRAVTPRLDGLVEDPFATIVEDHLDVGHGVRGLVGHAPTILAEAAEIVPFAVRWLERASGSVARDRRSSADHESS